MALDFPKATGTGFSNPVEQSLQINNVNLKLCLSPIDFLVNNLGTSTIDVDWIINHKRLSKVEVLSTSTDTGGAPVPPQPNNSGDIDTHYTFNNTVSKNPLYEYLEDANFTIFTNDKVKNCQILSLDFFSPTTANPTIIDPTKYFQVLDTIYTPIFETVINDFNDTYTLTVDAINWIGFDVDDLTNNPHTRNRRIQLLEYIVVSEFNHSVPNLVPPNQSRVLFQHMQYFNPKNTIITKPIASELGILAKLYRSTKLTQSTAMVETWEVLTDGIVQISNLKSSPLGDYSGNTNQIHYYPG